MCIKTVELKCNECMGVSNVEWDDDIFIEPERCPFCGHTVFPDSEEPEGTVN